MNIDEIFENLKPLNFGRRLVFQDFCKYLVENGKINQCCVDKYTSSKFIYEDEKVMKWQMVATLLINVVTLYGVYRLFLYNKDII